MVITTWPTAAVSPQLLASHDVHRATWASCAPVGLARTPCNQGGGGGQSWGSCWCDKGLTLNGPKNHWLAVPWHVHLPWIIPLLLEHEQWAWGSCGKKSAGRDSPRNTEWQRDRRTSGKPSKVLLSPNNDLLLLVIAGAASSCCSGCPEVPGSIRCHCLPLRQGHEGQKTAQWGMWPGLQEEQGER